MPGDLDLAMRVRADVAQARASFVELSRAVSGTRRQVTEANAASAASTMRVARAVAELRRVRREYQTNSNAYTRTLVAQAQANLTTERASRRAAQAALRKAQGDRQAALAAQQAARATDRLTAAERRNSAARATGRRGNARSTVQIQNAAFQIQDFAVQVAAGTSAVRAFGQQAPQLLGGFGAVGAVIGAVLAVALPLGAAFLNLGTDAEEAGEATQKLAESVDRLQELERVERDVDALAEAYGTAARQARDLIRAQQELAEQDAAAVLTDLIDRFESLIGAPGALEQRARLGAEQTLAGLVAASRTALDSDLADLISPVVATQEAALAELRAVLNPDDLARVAEAYDATIKETLLEIARELQKASDRIDDNLERQAAIAADRTSEALERLRARFGITADAAQDLIEAYERLAAANGFEAQAAAAGQLRKVIERLRAGQADVTNEQRDALTELLRGFLDVEDQILKAAAATDDLAPGIDDAAEAARKLADELAGAVQQLRRLQTRANFRLARAQAEVDFADDPAGRNARLREIFQDEQTQDIERNLRRDPDLSELDIIAEVNRQKELAGAIFDTETQADRLNDELRETAQAGRSGASGASRELRRLEEAQRKAREEAEKLRTATRDALQDYANDAIETRDDVAKAWRDGFRGLEDALTDFVTTGKVSFSDLARSILADLARIAIRANITGPLAQAFEGLFDGGPQLVSGPGLPGGATSPRPPIRPFHTGGNPMREGPRLPGLGPREVPAILEEGEAVLTGGHARALLGIERHAANRARAQQILRIAARYHTGGVAGLPGGQLPATPAPAGNAPMKLSVELNNHGTPQRVDSANARFDVRGLIVRLFLDDLASGGPMARGIQGMVPGTRL